MLELKLDGEWRFRSESSPEWLSGQVPGCVHSDLLRLGKIPDPNWRTNETDLQWIGQCNWTYRRTFVVAPSLWAEANVILRAHGLDTLATLRLNGKEVARADNMHRTWEWDVREFLQEGDNEIEFHFASPFPYLAEKGKIHPLEAWNEYHEIRHRGWLRKQHSNFGWDWSPVLVSCGIWRSISIVAWSGPRLLDVHVNQEHAEGSVHLSAKASLTEAAPAGTRLELEVSHGGTVVAQTTAPLTLAEAAPLGVTVSDPQLWWPAGMGAQPLYHLRVRLLDGQGAQLDSWERKIGLRTLRLIRRPDPDGESFVFEANGIPFFAKGANWANPLPYSEWPAAPKWQHLLRDAVLAHHNMIRIWGGAYFCPDEFYDLCDEIGLTIWQDFLYACGPYPSFDSEFLNNIEAEARDNVRRLRHHPCMALWCGNNELEGAFTAEKWTKMKMSFEDYDRIFNGVLKSAVAELDPQGNYWPASPVCTGTDRTVVSQDAGDAHVWEIWFSDAPFENFRNYRNRFISEFGFQSMPTRQTVELFTLPGDRQFNSPVLEHHQRSGPGNLQQLKALLTWFRLPSSFADQIDLSQLVQANCVKTGVEHWRRLMPRTMGALYWQLNDCWPCPSWSSIDFQGRWKALHYFSARFFAPVLLSGLEDVEKNTVEVHLTNDHAFEVAGNATCRVFDLSGNVLLEQSLEARVGGVTSATLGVIDLNRIQPQPARHAVVVQLEFCGKDGSRSSNLVLLDRPRKMELEDPGITFEISPGEGNTVAVLVSARRPAPCVWLEFATLDPRMSENFFALFPGQPQQVILQFAKPPSLSQIRVDLKIRHVRATYQTD